MILISVPCLILPINILIGLSIIGVMLADTRIIPKDLIYFSRFVPVGILCLRALAYLVAKKSFKQESYYFVKMWVPFLVLSFISTLYSLQPFITFQRALSALFAIVGFGIAIPLYLPKSSGRSDIIKIASVVIGASILYSLYLGSWGTAMMLEGGEFDRMYGIYINPNTLGLMAMQVFFLLVYWWLRERRDWYRWVLFIVIMLVGVTVLVSGSRASVLGACVGLLMFLKGNRDIYRTAYNRVWTLGLILISAYLIAGYFFPEYLGSVFRTETASRTILWKRAWILSKDAPYLGVGFGGSDPLFAQDAAYLKRIGVAVFGSHSSVMKLLVDLGFIGILLCGFPFALIIYQTWKYLPGFEDPKLGLVLLSFIVASMTDAIFEGWLFGFGSASTVPFWFFLALLCHQAYEAKSRVKLWRGYVRRAYLAQHFKGEATSRVGKVKLPNLNFRRDKSVSRVLTANGE